MSATHTPGFTAHNSLYRSNQHYTNGLIWIGETPATVPAYLVPEDGGGDCHVTCGECSHTCERTCQNTCLPVPYQESCCDSTQSCCNGKCANTAWDWANCGACGHKCPSGKVCIDGACGCLPGHTLCDGVCVDLSADSANCGDCGVTCASGYCCVGVCGRACGGGYCCEGNSKCCNTPFGGHCCAHKCNHTIFGNFCT